MQDHEYRVQIYRQKVKSKKKKKREQVIKVNNTKYKTKKKIIIRQGKLQLRFYID